MQVRTLQERRARARARVEYSAEMQPPRMEGMLLRTPKRAGGTHGCGERERESQVEDESKMATSSRTKNPGEATDDKKIKKPKRGRTTGMILLRWHVVCTRKVVRDGRLRPC